MVLSRPLVGNVDEVGRLNIFRGGRRCWWRWRARGLLDGAPDSGSIEILHWWKQGGEAEAIGALLDVYKQRNPDVKIVDSSVDGSALGARRHPRAGSATAIRPTPSRPTAAGT